MNGNTVTACPPAPQSEAAVLLSLLLDSQSEMQDAIAALPKRLVGVLGPSRPTETTAAGCAAGAEESETSPLCKALRERIITSNSMRHALLDVMHRLTV